MKNFKNINKEFQDILGRQFYEKFRGYYENIRGYFTKK